MLWKLGGFAMRFDATACLVALAILGLDCNRTADARSFAVGEKLVNLNGDDVVCDTRNHAAASGACADGYGKASCSAAKNFVAGGACGARYHVYVVRAVDTAGTPPRQDGLLRVSPAGTVMPFQPDASKIYWAFGDAFETVPPHGSAGYPAATNCAANGRFVNVSGKVETWGQYIDGPPPNLFRVIVKTGLPCGEVVVLSTSACLLGNHYAVDGTFTKSKGASEPEFIAVDVPSCLSPDSKSAPVADNVVRDQTIAKWTETETYERVDYRLFVHAGLLTFIETRYWLTGGPGRAKITAIKLSRIEKFDEDMMPESDGTSTYRIALDAKGNDISWTDEDDAPVKMRSIPGFILVSKKSLRDDLYAKLCALINQPH
jgi:hypothetical protein